MSATHALDIGINPLSVPERISWYTENLKIRVKDPRGGAYRSRILPLVLNPVQEEMEDYVVWAYAHNLPVRIIVLKARQEGVSTWVEAHMFLQTLLLPHQEVHVIAHDEDATQNLQNMYRRYVNNYPLLIPTDLANRRAISFQHNGSTIFCYTAGKKAGGGRSFNPTHMHGSEIDYWPDGRKLYDATAQGIAEAPWTFIALESTAAGPDGFMQEMWDQAVDGRNEYRPFFFGWHRMPDYQRPLKWAELKRYGPDAWVSRNLRLLERNIMEEGDAAEPGMGPFDATAAATDRDAGALRDGPQDARHGILPAGDAPLGSRPELHPGRGTPAYVPRGAERGAPHGGDPRHERAAFAADAVEPPAPGRLLGPGAPAPFDFSVGAGVVELGPGGRGGAHLDVGGSGGGPGAGRDLDGDARPDRPFFQRRDQPEGYRHGDLVPMGPVTGVRISLEAAVVESYSEEEHRLAAEFDLRPEQIAWLRYTQANKCRNDPVARRREYPSRPEEAFSASAAEVLNTRVLLEWLKLAKVYPRETVWFQTEELGPSRLRIIPHRDTLAGKTDIYEWPSRAHRYVAFFDPASGIGPEETDVMEHEGDWHVCCVMDVENGNQVAEYRSKDDHDQTVDQIEALGVLYRAEIFAIETNGGFGLPFVRNLVQRRTLKLFEREVWDGRARRKGKKVGWWSDTGQKSEMLAEGKRAVREQTALLRSVTTIREAMGLQLLPTGVFGHAKNKHDDGVMAYFGCILLRNRILERDRAEKEEDAAANSIVAGLRSLDRGHRRRTTMERMNVRSPFRTRAVKGGPKRRVDGRRSWS